MLPKGAFLLVRIFRELNVNHNVKIARILCLSLWQSMFGYAQLQAVIGSRWNPEIYAAFECRNLHRRAQHAFPRREIEIVKEISPSDAKIGVGGQPYSQIKVPRC